MVGTVEKRREPGFVVEDADEQELVLRLFGRRIFYKADLIPVGGVEFYLPVSIGRGRLKLTKFLRMKPMGVVDAD